MNEYEIRLRLDCLTPQRRTEVLHELARRHADLLLPLLPPPALICDQAEYDAGPDAVRCESVAWLHGLKWEDRQALLEWLGGRKEVSELSRILHAARSLLENRIDLTASPSDQSEQPSTRLRRSSAP